MARWRDIKETAVQTMKFSALGAVNFILTFVVFAVLLKIVEINYNIALFTAWFVGMIFMYVTNFVWVFQAGNSLYFDAQFGKFLATGIVSITLNMLALHLVVECAAASPFTAQILLIPPIVAFNFLAAKYFSLRRQHAA